MLNCELKTSISHYSKNYGSLFLSCEPTGENMIVSSSGTRKCKIFRASDSFSTYHHEHDGANNAMYGGT